MNQLKYKVNEVFYSIQGEGYWTGTPMAFIRLAGCNLSCSFCDTDHSVKQNVTAGQLLEMIDKRTKRVCITGGEPFIQNLEPLVRLLREKNLKVHIETNGYEPESESFLKPLQYIYQYNCWLTWSPKTELAFGRRFSEVKFLVGDGLDLWQETLHTTSVCDSYLRYFYLQPVEGTFPAFTRLNIEQAVELVKEHPELFRLSLQTHKMIGVR